MARRFKFIGGGDGFPLDTAIDVDVSDYEYVTCGGVTGGSASPAQIELSRRNAMKIYWNLKTATLTSSVGSEVSIDADDDHIDYPDFDDEYDLGLLPFEPFKRTCYGEWVAFKESEDGYVSIGVDPQVIRMYNGDTTDPDNFIGYGFDGFLTSTTQATGFIWNFNISSYGQSASSYIEEVSVDDIPFLGLASNPGGPLASYDISGLTATRAGSESLTFSDIDFYTY